MQNNGSTPLETLKLAIGLDSLGIQVCICLKNMYDLGCFTSLYGGCRRVENGLKDSSY